MHALVEKPSDSSAHRNRAVPELLGSCAVVRSMNIPPYNEDTGAGRLRYVQVTSGRRRCPLDPVKLALGIPSGSMPKSACHCALRGCHTCTAQVHMFVAVLMRSAGDTFHRVAPLCCPCSWCSRRTTRLSPCPSAMHKVWTFSIGRVRGWSKGRHTSIACAACGSSGVGVLLTGMGRLSTLLML